MLIAPTMVIRCECCGDDNADDYTVTKTGMRCEACIAASWLGDCAPARPAPSSGDSMVNRWDRASAIARSGLPRLPMPQALLAAGQRLLIHLPPSMLSLAACAVYECIEAYHEGAFADTTISFLAKPDLHDDTGRSVLALALLGRGLTLLHLAATQTSVAVVAALMYVSPRPTWPHPLTSRCLPRWRAASTALILPLARQPAPPRPIWPLSTGMWTCCRSLRRASLDLAPHAPRRPLQLRAPRVRRRLCLVLVLPPRHSLAMRTPRRTQTPRWTCALAPSATRCSLRQASASVSGSRWARAAAARRASTRERARVSSLGGDPPGT